MEEVNFKKCGRCFLNKPFSEFRKNKGFRDNLNWECKECCRTYSKKWNLSNPDYHRDYILFKTYNITIEDYNSFLVKQNYKCAICGISQEELSKNIKNTPINFAVDHDHNTGKVRGLLCFRCNSSLGGFNDSVDVLDKAKQYLTTHLNPTVVEEL
jgi:hypothetical protein